MHFLSITKIYMGNCYGCNTYKCIEIDINNTLINLEKSRNMRYGYIVAAENRNKAIEYVEELDEFCASLSPYRRDPYINNIRILIYPYSKPKFKYYKKYSCFSLVYDKIGPNGPFYILDAYDDIVYINYDINRPRLYNPSDKNKSKIFFVYRYFPE